MVYTLQESYFYGQIAWHPTDVDLLLVTRGRNFESPELLLIHLGKNQVLWRHIFPTESYVSHFTWNSENDSFAVIYFTPEDGNVLSVQDSLETWNDYFVPVKTTYPIQNVIWVTEHLLMLYAADSIEVWDTYSQSLVERIPSPIFNGDLVYASLDQIALLTSREVIDIDFDIQSLIPDGR